MGRVKNQASSEVLKNACRFKNEAEFQTWVNEVFNLNVWLWYHTHRSDRSQPGFPDLCAVRGDMARLLFAELKMPGNKPTPSQGEWLQTLKELRERTIYPRIEVYLWYPKDEDEIVRVAGGGRPLW